MPAYEIRPVKSYSVTVDYGMSVEEAVQRGNFAWPEPDINSTNFPTERKGQTKLAIDLFQFSHSVTSRWVIEQLDIIGYRPAELLEFLALAYQYPDVSRGHPVAALGSMWRSREGWYAVPDLAGNASRRGLGLSLFSVKWVGGWYFGAVCK